MRADVDKRNDPRNVRGTTAAKEGESERASGWSGVGVRRFREKEKGMESEVSRG